MKYLSPPPCFTELKNNSGDLNTSNESDESHFYIGLGEDGFCPSQSIHDSDISETDSEFDGFEDTFEEEFDGTFDSELNETLSHAEGVELNMSVLTEYGDEDVVERGSSLAEMALNTSILTEIVGEEKKEESDEGLSDIMQNDIEAMDAYHRKSTHEAYHRAVSMSSPISHNLGMSPKARVNDSLISGEDAFLSSSLKYFVNEQEDNLKSLLSSIDGIAATPGRIEGVVQRGMFEEDDSDDGMLGLTPLTSRLESVALDCGRKRGCKLFSSPEEGVQLNETNKEDEHRHEILFSPTLAESDSAKGEKEIDPNHVPLQSLSTVQESKDNATCDWVSSSNQPQHEASKEVNEPTDDLLLEATSDEAPVSREDFDLGLTTAAVLTEEKTEGTIDDDSGTDLLQSPEPEQVDLHTAETPSIIEPTSLNASPLEVAAAEFSTRSSLLEYLRDSPASPEDMHHISNKDDTFSSSNDPEDDEIPASFKEMFANAESVLQKELASPYLEADKSINIDGTGTFCDDYIKPSSDLSPKVSLAPSNNTELLFTSPTGCIPLDTANLSKNALEAETTAINLDSLKEVFLKAESQLESAESSIHRELQPEANGFDDNSETDTTFDTANFSMSGLMAAVDDFFDANDEFVDALDGKVVSANRSETSTHTSCKNSDNEPFTESNESIFKEHEAKSTTDLSENHSSAADSDSTIDITQTLDRVGDYLKRMTVQETWPDANVNADSSSSAGAEFLECTVPILSVDTEVVVENSDQTDDLTPLASNTTVELSDDRSGAFENIGLPAKSEPSASLAVNSETMGLPEESKPAGDEPLHSDDLDVSGEPTTVVDKDEDNETNCEIEEQRDELNASGQLTSPVEQKLCRDNKPKSADRTHDEGNTSSLEASARSDEMDESMFMPNTSMEISLIASPAPAVNNEPEQALQPTPEEDEDSGALSDEDFFPNRDLTKVPTSKVVASISSVEPAPPAFKLDVKSPSVNDTAISQAFRYSHSNLSHSSPPRESAANVSHRARPNSRKTTAPKTPPSNVKPATKRTKLSTITNTANSPKRMTAAVKEKTKPSAVEKKRVARVASKTSNLVAPTSAISSQLESRLTTAAPKHTKTERVVGISPRTSSMRRSLVAVAKNQRQSNIPKPKPTQRSSSISRSDRLEQLAKPRAVVQKEITPKNSAQKKVANAKPPSFLNRERKKSTVKSTDEREAEEMSSIKPFKASRIKGSSVKVKSRFNTPRGHTSKPTLAQSDGKPFKSLREEIINYNFRQQPSAVTTPINPKNLSAPSFMQHELAKAPKQNVPTLGESIINYDFRATPAAKTPINPNAKPPSFLSRPSYIPSLTKSSEEIELEECKNKFKACPLPVSSVSRHRPVSRPRDERCLTTPRPPKLHTSARKMATPIILTQDDIELQKQFHARPLPASVYGSSTPRRYYGNTPQPSTDEVELSKKFHALPLPEDIYGRTVGNDATPFHVRASEQYERAMERKKQMLEEEMEQLKRSRERKATPLPPTNWQARPIRIEKSSKELVQPRPPRLSLDARSRERQEFDDHVQQKKDAEAAAEAARREEEARTEADELRKRRSLAIEEGGLCFRARPVSIKYE
jgi:hypothetical protein